MSMRFTKAQYEEAISNLQLGLDQLTPDSRCCAICGDSGHHAWECGHNPLVAMVICEALAKQSEALHDTLHLLAGFETSMGVQRGPAKIVLPDADESALVAAAKRVCASLRADSAPVGSPIVIDDLGLEKDPRKTFQPYMDWLINTRYGGDGWTVLTTNLPLEDFKRRYGDRIYDRLRHRACWYEVSHESLRGRPEGDG